MTLLETIALLKFVARKQPNINGIVESGDIFDLNKDEYQQKYAAFCATEGEHEINESWSRFSFTLFYVDRLILDKSNKEEIHSSAISFFQNFQSYMLKNYPKIFFEAGTVIPFTERFSADCAGAYMSCNIITTPQSLCPIESQQPGPEPEPITITTYEFEGELEHYTGSWCTLTQGGNFPGSFTGQATFPLDYDILFNEIHFPFKISNVNNAKNERVMYCVLKGKYILGDGTSATENQFLPSYGYPFFVDAEAAETRPYDAYREPLASGYIVPENKTYDDFTIKLEKTCKLKAGESVILLIRGQVCYAWIQGNTSSSSLSLYELEGKKSMPLFIGVAISVATANSPFNISWYRYHPASQAENKYIACQPVLKLTTYQ